MIERKGVNFGKTNKPTLAASACLLVFIQHVTFRIQTVPSDKITIDFWRSRKHLHDSDLHKAKKYKSQINIRSGVSVLSNMLRFGSRRLFLFR